MAESPKPPARKAIMKGKTPADLRRPAAGRAAPAAAEKLPEAVVVELPLLPNSRGNQRWHHYQRHRYDRELQADLLPCFLAQRPAEPFPCCSLEVTFYFPDQRMRDPDNYYSGLKPWLDAAVAAGIVASDRWTCLPETRILSRCRPGQPGTRLEFRPLFNPELIVPPQKGVQP